MALTQIIRQECPVCNKIAVESSRLKIGKTVIIRLACGHTMNDKTLELDDSAYNSIVFSDGAKPREYQIEAVKFAERASLRCIIADQQGLGKTIEVLSLLRLHAKEMLPLVYVCPTTIKLQTMFEIHRICGNGKEYLTQVIQSGKEKAMPGFQVYVVTYDMLKNDDLFDYLPEGTIKTVIVDECQKIKDHLSGRAKAVQRVARNVKNFIGMSGTPIKNNAGEYFTVLNLVAPRKFPHYQKFIDNYCDAYSNGWGQKIGGLKNPERFHEDTEGLIIRRTKEEVLKDLPEKERKFYHVELDKKLNKAYAAAMSELDDMLYDDEVSEFERSTNMIAIMSKLRHITGVSKVAECADYVTEFLISCPRKLVVFTHHNNVMELLEGHLNPWLVEGGYDKVAKFHSGLDATARNKLVKDFESNPTQRVMIASGLASGIGLNLQFMSDAVILERYWNPPDEEQIEDRFHRFGQKNNVSITYMIASGTIDEYFTELVEVKRAIIASTVDKKAIEWNQQSLMKELATILVTKGRDKWRL